MDSKGWMVVVCSAVGVGCLLLYVLLMGRWLPTRNAYENYGGEIEHEALVSVPRLSVFTVCGILCSGILLGGRISAEAKDQQVSVAFSQEDLTLLAQESGLAVETWREALQQAGISHWIGQEPASFLLPGEAVGAATQVPLALVENHDRTSVLLPEGVDLETYDGPMVKTLYLYEDYANRATEGDAQEIENLLFRGVVDRGMRLLLLTPFRTEAGDYILDPGVYVTCLEDLGARLEARGLALGETFSCLDTEPASPLLLLGAGLVPVLLGGWLVCRWSRLQGRGWILVVVAVVALAALSQVRPDWMAEGADAALCSDLPVWPPGGLRSLPGRCRPGSPGIGWPGMGF